MEHGDGSRLLAAGLLGLALLVGACGGDELEPAPPAAAPTETAAPAYDGTLEPSAAALALVPEDAATLAVTDFDAVRADLGVDELSDRSAPAEIASFWQRAAAERPLLAPGLLRPDDQRLAERYGVDQLDVAWEAHFSDAGGKELGWVLRFRDGTDMTQVAAAVHDPQSPMRGGAVDEADLLVTSGAAADPARSWAGHPELAELVGLPANATFVSRTCDPEELAADTGDLEELGAYAVQLEGSLATAWLGTGRGDLFTRMRLGESDPAFTAAYDGGVADPLTGRIGYVMADPPAAAALALEHRLPFAVCSSE